MDTTKSAEEHSVHRFNAYDYNFNGYEQNKLEVLCKHNLPVRTVFPKLVMELYLHPKFDEWMKTHEINLSPERVLDILVECVGECSPKSSTTSGDGMSDSDTASTTMLDLQDEGIWQTLVEKMLVFSKDPLVSNSDITPPQENLKLKEETDSESEDLVVTNFSPPTIPHLSSRQSEHKVTVRKGISKKGKSKRKRYRYITVV